MRKERHRFDPAHSVETILKILYSFVFCVYAFLLNTPVHLSQYNDLNIWVYKKTAWQKYSLSAKAVYIFMLCEKKNGFPINWSIKSLTLYLLFDNVTVESNTATGIVTNKLMYCTLKTNVTYWLIFLKDVINRTKCPIY